MNGIRVLLADDHTLVRAGLRALLQTIEGIEVVAEAGSGQEALQAAQAAQPDVALVDIAMPGMTGLELTRQLAKQSPDVRVVMLSMHATEGYVRDALRGGAVGYLLKGAEPLELDMALKAVMRGETYLTPAVSKAVVTAINKHAGGPGRNEPTTRQREILRLIANGLSTKEIAYELNLSVKTVETHRADLMHRLDIHDVAGLVRYAIRTGVIPPEV